MAKIKQKDLKPLIDNYIKDMQSMAKYIWKKELDEDERKDYGSEKNFVNALIMEESWIHEELESIGDLFMKMLVKRTGIDPYGC